MHATKQISVDRHDLSILAELQRDGHITHSALGDIVHLSTSQVSRRVQRLLDAGVIDHFSAVLDPSAVGLGVMAFVQVVLGRHGDVQGEQFERAVADMPEVLECFAVTGEADYMVRIVAQDLSAFSTFMMNRLLRIPGVTNVKSNIAIKKIKQLNVLPLDHVTQPNPSKQKIYFILA